MEGKAEIERTGEFGDILEVCINCCSCVSLSFSTQNGKTQGRGTDFRNSINVRLVKTMLVLSQSSMPEISLSILLLKGGSHEPTETSWPFSFLRHVDNIGRRKSIAIGY
jgi:hypothetical protein